MAEHVTWLWEVGVKDLDGFKALMDEMVESTKAEDGTLVYDWHIDEAGTTAQLLERFESNEAAMIHLKGFGAFAKRFLSLVQPKRLVLLGPAGDDVRGAMDAMKPETYAYLGGFSR